MRRRAFLQCLGTLAAAPTLATGAPPGESPSTAVEDDKIRALVDAHRPGRLAKLPPDFNQRVGATHVAGKYHLTAKPFLLEGAEKLLELGARLGKFWFEPDGIARSYPFNSRWGAAKTFVDLATSDYFEQLFALPFSTVILEAHAPCEHGWKQDQPREFYEAITQEFHDFAAHLYRRFRDRRTTFVLQHWEGDWMLRGRGGEKWDPPPANWPNLCEQMQKWLVARQAGVTAARRAHAAGATCVVAHAAEVNRVADIWKGIPTVTDKVLPGVELDLVSYSCYDGLRDPVTLWRCIDEIKRRARTGALFGAGAVYLGEIGLPENEQRERVAERWDGWLGAALATEARYIVQWELYCNELNPRLRPAPKPPIKDPQQARGFWLVRPDGAPSETGRFFAQMWQKAAG